MNTRCKPKYLRKGFMVDVETELGLEERQIWKRQREGQRKFYWTDKEVRMCSIMEP